MTGLEDQPYGYNERSSQEAGLRCLVLVLFAIASLIFGVTRLDIFPSAWIKDFLNQLELRDVEIISTLSLSEEKGEFTASGAAVAARILCERGTVQDLEYQDISPVPGELTDLLVRKRFLCGNWSGYFLMDLDVDITESGATGSWEIVGGVRDYENLIGSGTFVGVYQGEDIILDTFTGEIKIDE